MPLSEKARSRLADLVELQPTKNAELQERWDMSSGSEVHQFLESELGDYYYRDEASRICATVDAPTALGGDPEDGDHVIQISHLQSNILEVLAGPDDRSESVVSVLHGLRAAGHDPPVPDVRSGLRNLVDKGLVTVERRTVPTFRRSFPAGTSRVEVREDLAGDSAASEESLRSSADEAPSGDTLRFE